MIARRLKGESGASAVEMAIITALVTLLMLGGIDMGLYFYNKHVLTWGSREAARWGVVVTADPNRRSEASITSYARAYYNNHLIPAGSGGAVAIVSSRSGVDCPVSTVDNPCLLTVNATYNYNLFFASFLGVNMPSLVALSKMYME